MPESIDIPDVTEREPWEQLEQVIDARDTAELTAFLRALPPADTAYTISHLDDDHRSHLFSLLAMADPDLGADLLEHFDDGHTADMLEELPPQIAAKLLNEMDSDEQTDVLSAFGDDAAAAVLEKMHPEEAEDIRGRLDYDHDTAGGLMITEYLAYPADQDVSEVRRDLRRHAKKYNEYEVRYLYGIDAQRRLIGVCPMRTLVMAQPGQPLRETLITEPFTVSVAAHLDDLEDMFDRVDLMAVPVVDDQQRLLGIVRRSAVQEAVGEIAKEDLAKFGGIIRGEELRSMALNSRVLRRLAFLLPILVLLMVSASIIALFEETVGKLPILAAFLPVVAGLCGSGGGQSVAVSMREISLGLIKPSDYLQVLAKEAAVALVNGLILGLCLFALSLIWKGNVYLSMVLGLAVPVVMVIAKCIGGTVPLLLRKVGMDPAMASVPILTTAVDLASFLTVLLLAEMAMTLIAP